MPIPSHCLAPDGGVGRGSGELANHAVLPSVTGQLLLMQEWLHVTGGHNKLNIALGHILRKVVSGPTICPGPPRPQPEARPQAQNHTGPGRSAGHTSPKEQHRG